MSSDSRSSEEVREGVVAYLRAEFGIGESELARDTKLVSTGLLDSVALVQLATWAERAFGISIPDQDIDADHLDSVAMIVDYIRRRLEG